MPGQAPRPIQASLDSKMRATRRTSRQHSVPNVLTVPSEGYECAALQLQMLDGGEHRFETAPGVMVV
jgi:hypothetical protein